MIEKMSKKVTKKTKLELAPPSEEDSVEESGSSAEEETSTPQNEESASGDEENASGDEESTSDEEAGGADEEKKPAEPQKKTNVINKNDSEKNARTIHVGRIPVSSDSVQIRNEFAKFGDIEDVVMMAVPAPATNLNFVQKKTQRKIKGFYAFITFKQQESAEKAVNSLIMHNGEKLSISLCSTYPKNVDRNNSIHFKNLHYAATTDELWKTFQYCGYINSVNILKDRHTKKSRGIGYINFEKAESVARALEMKDVVIRGRELQIFPCVDKTEAVKRKREENEQSEGEEDNQEKKESINASKSETVKKQRKIEEEPAEKKEKVKKITPKKKVKAQKSS